MNKKNLLKYLYTVRNLEANIYTQNLLIDHLTRKANALGNYKKIEKSKPYAFSPFSMNDGKWMLAYMFIFVAIIVLSCKVTYPLLYDFIEAQDPWVDAAESLLEVLQQYNYPLLSYGQINAQLKAQHYIEVNKDAIKYSIYLAIIAFAISIVCGVIINIICTNKRQKALDKKALSEYQISLKNDNNRVRQELEIKKKLLAQVNSITVYKKQQENILQKYYGLNVISKNYRGLIPVTTFCEYFEDGICTTMEEAYGRYRYESLLKKIITDLQDIRQKLNLLIENQKMLYDIICEANDTINRIDKNNNNMTKTLNEIHDNSEVNKFNSKSAAINSQATNEFLIMKELLKK